ncbi:transcriptional regulator [Sphingomonas gei]|uniref:Transcriptional regulator n=1 Tax=Sphingomonas gei TaxID=1395960 RepID=A0A4S1XIY8_9SPHN|nr:helix-turn-helix domain-containing protein [Sphingomonas gei]TGX55096.1 transcriptional regulator [Sphingomonas gei]
MESQKITTSDFSKMRRWYRDACGTALAMDLIGERWALLIVRELLLGPRRFGEIRSALDGLSANILTQRLEGLEKAGILRRRALPSPANAQAYELTKWGRALEEPIFALSRWAAGSPAHDVTMPLSNTAFMLSLRTMMDRKVDTAFAPDIGFRIGGEPFRAQIVGGLLEIERRDPDGAEVIFAGEPTKLAATFYGRALLAESMREGRVSVTGDSVLGQRFVDLFGLPVFSND